MANFLIIYVVKLFKKQISAELASKILLIAFYLTYPIAVLAGSIDYSNLIIQFYVWSSIFIAFSFPAFLNADRRKHHLYTAKEVFIGNFLIIFVAMIMLIGIGAIPISFSLVLVIILLLHYSLLIYKFLKQDMFPLLLFISNIIILNLIIENSKWLILMPLATTLIQKLDLKLKDRLPKHYQRLRRVTNIILALTMILFLCLFGYLSQFSPIHQANPLRGLKSAF